jgi:hypothetical protein
MLPICAGIVLLAPPAMLAELADVPNPFSALLFVALLGLLPSSLLKNRFNSDVTVLTRVIVPASECIEFAEADPLALRRLALAVK